ncbi:MAG: Lrp/AsnC family transcriptional regulator [Alphaproteobacteria bacterium]
MRRVKLDRIDLKILKDLQDDGRMTNVDLAKRAGISAPPCLRRVRALEKAGFITGYHAELDPQKLGYGVTVFAQIKLSSNAEHDLEDFRATIDSWPEVRESYMLAGDYDFQLKVVAPDWDGYQKFLTKKLTAAPKVSQIKSFLSVAVTKKVPGVPVNLENAAEPGDGDEV